MLIKLIKPHIKQKEIVDACLDDSIFFIVAVIGRQFGKTTISENMAIYWALNEPKSVIYWVSPTDAQSQKVYKDIINAIYESGCVESKKMPRGDTEILFKNGSKILFRSAQSEDNLRGQSVNYMILDEAAFIKRSTVETILLPMLSVKGKKCLFISTPKGKNYLYDYYLNGKTKDKWKSLRYSTYDSPLSNTDMIDMFRTTLSSKIFQQEVEAEFIDSSSVFNNISDVMTLDEIDNPVNGEKYWAGIDIGLINDPSVLSIIDQNGNLVKYYRWENIEAPELINKIIDINNKWKFISVAIENNNQGLVIYQSLKRTMRNIIEFNTNSKTKPEIINDLIHAFNMRSFNIIKNEYLRIELEAFIFKQNDIGNIKFMADSGFHDDCVMSLAIGRWCWKSKKDFNPFFTQIYSI
jgi:hypothetical protein